SGSRPRVSGGARPSPSRRGSAGSRQRTCRSLATPCDGSPSSITGTGSTPRGSARTSGTRCGRVARRGSPPGRARPGRACAIELGAALAYLVSLDVLAFGRIRSLRARRLPEPDARHAPGPPRRGGHVRLPDGRHPGRPPLPAAPEVPLPVWGAELLGRDPRVNDALLRTEQLSRSYGSLLAVDRVDLSVREGELRSIIG